MSNEESPRSEEKPEKRRSSDERRKRAIPVAFERRSGKDRRDGPPLGERRRQVDPTTCEKDYSDEEIDFMKAMDLYKRSNRRPVPDLERGAGSPALDGISQDRIRRTALPGLPVMVHRED